MKTLYVAVLLLLFKPDLVGQIDSLLSEIAQQSAYPFSMDESFHGEGWEKVIAAAQAHKYFLIGEDHGLAEIPKFTSALVEQMEYDLFVTEIDSITAYLAQQISRSDSARIKRFHETHPSALSFYSAKEEFEVLTALAEHDADIWGLDQVSLFSTGLVFREMARASKSEEAKTLATNFADLSDVLFQEATSSGNFDTLFIFSAKQQVFDQLWDAFENETPEARNILGNLEASWKIYNGIDGANYSIRLGGMKSKLLNYYIDQVINKKEYDRILYKFGAYHVGKAAGVFGGFDVGNFAANLAEAEGESSYHLMIIGRKGGMNTFLPTDGMQKVAFDIADQESALNDLMPFAELLTQDDWMFFDLNAIRSALRKANMELDGSFLEFTLNGYDGLVIIPEATASKG